jgi:arabinogalactan oligomer/maltooligosaccharide transport system substrate-binding protein
MKSMKHSWLALLLALSFVLAACGAEATPVPPTSAPAVATDTVAAPAAAPTDTVAAPAAPTDTVAAAAPTDTVAAPAADTTPTVAPTETPVALGKGSKTITIWHGWEGEYLKTIQSIFADYVASHPDISIQLLHVADIDKKVQNAVPAGVGPDIVAWVDDHIGQSALLGVIDPLDGMQGIDANYLSTNYVGVAKEAVTYDGKIYALPESMEAVTMIYNKKLITEDKLPKTTTELVEQAKTYNAANQGNYYFAYNVKDPYFSAFLFYGAGAQYVDAQGNVGLNSDGAVAAGQYIRSLQGLMPKDVDYGVADSLFKDGKAPITINGPWYIADLQKAGIDFGLAKLPAVDFGAKGPAKPFVGVKVLMLAHGSKNPTDAVDLMKYYTAKEQQIKLAQGADVVPANKDAGAAVSSNVVITGFNNQAADGVPLPNTPFMNALWDPAGKAITALYSGTDDPAKVMADAQKAAEDAVAKMK